MNKVVDGFITRACCSPQKTEVWRGVGTEIVARLDTECVHQITLWPRFDRKQQHHRKGAQEIEQDRGRKHMSFLR